MRIKILDCTLRDGGYINNWKFSKVVGKSILTSLEDSHLDIVECGYLSDKSTSLESTLFNDVNHLKSYFDLDKETNRKIVVMINYGDFDVDNLPPNENNIIFGIRLAFHQKDADKALEYGKKVISKGYKLFIQPMVTALYSDYEFIELIEKVNKFNPYAFYIVDSFGSIDKQELLRYLLIADDKLNQNTVLGFHGHNNMQFVLTNAIITIESVLKREIIIDSSIYGMGRGAGNLSTEIIIDYLNKYFGTHYKIEPLLEVIDNFIVENYKSNPWGYSSAQYLSARYNCHPDYASFLVDKKKLNTRSINSILSSIAMEKRLSFDYECAEKSYLDYLNREAIGSFKSISFLNRDILVISSGLSAREEKQKVEDYIHKNNPVIISINHNSDLFESDYIFFSNQKRYDQHGKSLNIEKCIITSNVNTIDRVQYGVKFSDLYDFIEIKSDNSTILFLSYLAINGKPRVAVSGLDGFGNKDNYYYDEPIQINSNVSLESENEIISDGLNRLSRKMHIDIITSSRFKI
jgi:hypothetical protein